MNPPITPSSAKSLPLTKSADALPERIELSDGGLLLFWREFIPADVSTAIFAELRDEVPWEQMLFRGNSEPRLTKWMGDHPYRYSGVTRPPAPLHPRVTALRVEAEKLAFGAAQGQYRGVLLNYYRNGLDKIGLHADAESDLLRDAPITSFSFGATRRFILRHGRTREKIELGLGHGTALVMAGTTQRFWKHEIPAEPDCREGRINLTLRQMAMPPTER